jgi:prepilin-type N-terminal cleavage/methylation domain-containing protein
MRRLGRNDGFTLVELAIVCVVIGILASIAMPNYARTRAQSGRASCISNQRNLFAAATVYAAEHGITNAVLTSADLVAAGAAPARLGDCHEEHIQDGDDYQITIQNGEVIDVECLVVGADHPWTP